MVESVEDYKQKTKEQEVPFDLKTDRYMDYDPEKPGDSVAKLIRGLRDSFSTERQDSPVFLSLPDLKPQKREGFIPVPLGFGEAVQRAKDARGLTLLGLEAEGFRWESSGFRVVGRALLLIKAYGAAKNAWESLYKLDNFDYEANTSFGSVSTIERSDWFGSSVEPGVKDCHGAKAICGDPRAVGTKQEGSLDERVG